MNDLIEKEDFKKEVDNLFHAAVASVCACYEHSQGIFPDNCSCDTREDIQKIISALIAERRRVIKKYDL